MNRTGLLLALGLGVVAGAVFGAFSMLDLAVAGLFYDARIKMFRLGYLLWLGQYGWTALAREAGGWVTAALAAPAAVALIGKLARPALPMALPPRAVLYLIGTLVLAPGLMANVLLKDHWGRPRPIDVVEFGGEERFVPWWDPRGTCAQNCSFVSGETAGAFWTLAPASLAPAPVRPLAYAGALAFGTAVALLRMALGGHFASDVLFAAVFTFLIVWAAYRVLYGLHLAAFSDQAIEAAIERLVSPLHRVLGARRAIGSAARPR